MEALKHVREFKVLKLEWAKGHGEVQNEVTQTRVSFVSCSTGDSLRTPGNVGKSREDFSANWCSSVHITDLVPIAARDFLAEEWAS